MIPILAAALVAAAAGAAKHYAVDAPKEERERKLAAETTRNSYWTGLRGQMPKESDAAGEALTWAGAGANFAQNSNDADFSQQMQKDDPRFAYWARMRS